MNVGVRYIHRRMPRILEDIGTARWSPTISACPVSTASSTSSPMWTTTRRSPRSRGCRQRTSRIRSITTMPSNSRRTSGCRTTGRFSRRTAGRGFGATSKVSTATTTASRIRRSARCSTSRPTTHLTHRIGVPRFGYKGDIRYLGAAGAGPLPNDRHAPDQGLRHLQPAGWAERRRGHQPQFRCTPLTALAANPNYHSPGEIPMTATRRGHADCRRLPEADAIRGRTINAHVDYAFGTSVRRVVLLMDVFNLGNLQRVTATTTTSNIRHSARIIRTSGRWATRLRGSAIRRRSRFASAHGSSSRFASGGPCQARQPVIPFSGAAHVGPAFSFWGVPHGDASGCRPRSDAHSRNQRRRFSAAGRRHQSQQRLGALPARRRSSSATNSSPRPPTNSRSPSSSIHF